MLVTFSSTAAESITMFGEPAVQLLKLMGATGRIPGGLSAEELPPAIARLEAAVERLRAEAKPEASGRPADDEEGDEAPNREPPVALQTRAVPLIDLLKRAATAGAAVMWESK